METPASTRRVTRSLAAINTSGGSTLLSSKKADDCVSCQTKSTERNNKERTVLIDITNDSPIVGVAMQTPSSGMRAMKNNSRIKRTPGSGEALLRGQVKTLLQKVEEEAEVTKITLVTRRPFLHLVSSPMGLVAPTPANTPQVPNFPDADEVETIAEEHSISSQEEEIMEGMKSLSISRSLLLDFTDKPEATVDDVRSKRVNEEEEEDEEEEYQIFYRKEEKEKTKAEFAGKHTRFVYESDAEEIC